MSVITKLAIAVVGVLLIALSIESVMMMRTNAKYDKAAQQLSELKINLDEARNAVKTQAVVADVTDEVVTSATKRITTNTEKGVAIKAVVDNVTKRVANEEISNTVASAVYTNSMWDAFCTAKPSDSTCSSR